MANLTTSTDILKDVLFRCGEATDGTSDFHDQALVTLNRAYREIWMGGQAFDPQINETWWWLKAESSIIMQPVYKTGTIAVTQNSASVTFSTAPSDSKTGWFFKVDDWSDVFKISSHTASSTSATLDTVYTGDTDATASFRVMKLEYDLPSDFLKMNGEMRQYQREPYSVPLEADRVMEDMHPLHKLMSGAPDKYAFVDSDTIRFNTYGDEDGDYIRVDLNYLKKPSDLAEDTNEPLIPSQYRHILSDFATMYLMIDLNDDRSGSAATIGKAGMRSMSIENRQKWAAAGEPGNIVTRQEQITTRVLKTQGGLVLYHGI
jgi:hypothetical protein